MVVIMADIYTFKDIPVLLLYDIDPAWSYAEQLDVKKQTAKLADCIRKSGHSVKPVQIRNKKMFSSLSSFDPEKYIVFNWCECIPGIPHSEASVVEILESMKFTFTGSSSETLRIGSDKEMTRIILRRHKIPHPKGKVYKKADVKDWKLFPAIVKSIYEHCSLGITDKSVVISPEELYRQVDYMIRKFKQPAIVEEFIDGREIHIGLWGNKTINTYPPIELDYSACKGTKERLCTYNAKFHPRSADFKRVKWMIPAQLSDNESSMLKNTAISAYKAIGCRDYARVDLRMKNGRFYVLDINPNPDLSIDDCMIASARKAGVSYGALNSRILRLAAERHPAIRQMRT